MIHRPWRLALPLLCCATILTACGNDVPEAGGGYPDISSDGADPTAAAVAPDCPTQWDEDALAPRMTVALEDHVAWIAPKLLHTAPSLESSSGEDVMISEGETSVPALTSVSVDGVAAGPDAFLVLHRGGGQDLTDSSSDRQLSLIDLDGTVAWTVNVEPVIDEARENHDPVGEDAVSVSWVEQPQLIVSLFKPNQDLLVDLTVDLDPATGDAQNASELAELPNPETPSYSGTEQLVLNDAVEDPRFEEPPLQAAGWAITQDDKLSDTGEYIGPQLAGTGPNGETWAIEASGHFFTCGDVLYGSNDDGQLFVLDPTTGEQVGGPYDLARFGLTHSYTPILAVTPEGIWGWQRGDEGMPDFLYLISDAP